MKSMPFYSQIVNWNDEDSGFPDPESIQQWERNCCGIACLRMILDYYGITNEDARTSYWNLLQLGLKRSAYSEKGWIHRGLLEMAGEYGIYGQCHRRTNVQHLVETIRKGCVCIVSVTRCFLGGQKDDGGEPLPTGGHLVVAYDAISCGTLTTAMVCNHPSTGRSWNKAGWVVEIEKWENSFSGNYIEFYSGQGESGD